MNKREEGRSIFLFIDILRILNFRRYPFSVMFFFLILSIYVLLAVMPFSLAIQNALMEKFHVRQRPYVFWALTQIVPNMYNFGNEIWVSTSPLTPADIENKDLSPGIVMHQRVNHYPLRALYFSLHREVFTADHYYVYVRSQYRNNKFVSIFDMKREGRGWTIDLLDKGTKIE